MVPQTVLPFKLGTSDETLTAHAGLALFGEYCRALGLGNWLNQELPAPGSGAGYAASEHALSLVLMLQGGGRRLEDIRTLRADTGLRSLLQLAVPSSDALGDWLRRMGAGTGLTGLTVVQQRVVRHVLSRGTRREHTLDIDATQIVAEKATARYTYKGELGYMPMLGHLAETGVVVHDEFRDGNEAPAARNREFIQACQAQMPRGHRITAIRADSAAYQASLFNDCEAHGQRFAIGACRDGAVKEAIAAIPASDWSPYRDGEIAETVHSMNQTHKAFRLIVVRRGVQGELFDADTPRYRYSVIASNRHEGAAAIMDWYRQRGEASENRIKELKLGFGMEYMPCGQFAANAVFLRLGTLAYNLYKGFLRCAFHTDWHKHQIQTVRWRLYQTAGKIVRHAGQVWLKVSRDTAELFASVRHHCWQEACATDST